jgi:predicted phage terminase large subunit-like protein
VVIEGVGDGGEVEPQAQGPRMTPKEKAEMIRVVQEGLTRNLKILCTQVFSTPHWSRVHDELEAFLKTTGKRIHIELPRGHLKSHIVTQAWTIQEILRNPDIRVLIVNAVEGNSAKMMRWIRANLSEGTPLSKLYGRFETETWSQDELLIRQRRKQLVAPTVMAAGIQKTLTSQHFDLIIADDIVVPDNVQTKEQREKIYDFYLSLFDLLEPDGRIVVIGTRYHQDDLYARILEENNEHHNWSCFIRSCYNPDGTILFPEKFTQAQLDDIKKKSFYHFSTQYLNNPIDPENADFKTEWIKYYDPTTKHPMNLYLCVDPASSLGRDADYSAGTVSGKLSDGMIRVVDFFKKRLVPSELVDEIFEMVRKWRSQGHYVRVGVEAFTLKTLKQDLQNKMKAEKFWFQVDEIKKMRGPNGERREVKEARIRGMQPLFEQGLIEIRKDMTDFVDELLTFPRGKHDDLIDSLSLAMDKLLPGTETVPVKQIRAGTMNDLIRRMESRLRGTEYEEFMADLKMAV